MNTGTVSEELARLYLEFSNSVRTDDGEAARLIYRQLRTLGQSITPILDEAMRAASVSDDEKNSSFNSRAETEADKAEVGTELPDTDPTDQNTVPYEITETIDTAARLQTPAAPLFVVPDAPKQISAHVAAEQGAMGATLTLAASRSAMCYLRGWFRSRFAQVGVVTCVASPLLLWVFGSISLHSLEDKVSTLIDNSDLVEQAKSSPWPSRSATLLTNLPDPMASRPVVFDQVKTVELAGGQATDRQIRTETGAALPTSATTAKTTSAVSRGLAPSIDTGLAQSPPVAPATLEPLSRAELTALLTRGDSMFRIGDITSPAGFTSGQPTLETDKRLFG
jgi:hypothetical protein